MIWKPVLRIQFRIHSDPFNLRGSGSGSATRKPWNISGQQIRIFFQNRIFSRIRRRYFNERIRGSGSGSNWNGSTTLIKAIQDNHDNLMTTRITETVHAMTQRQDLHAGVADDDPGNRTPYTQHHTPFYVHCINSSQWLIKSVFNLCTVRGNNHEQIDEDIWS